MSPFRILLVQRWSTWWWQLMCYKTCTTPVKSSPQTNQHPTYYRPDAIPVAQPTVSEHWRGKKSSHSIDLLTPSSPGAPQLSKGWWGKKLSHSIDLLKPSSPGAPPTLSLTINSSWFPWGGLLTFSPLTTVSQNADTIQNVTQDNPHDAIYCI